MTATASENIRAWTNCRVAIGSRNGKRPRAGFPGCKTRGIVSLSDRTGGQFGRSMTRTITISLSLATVARPRAETAATGKDVGTVVIEAVEASATNG